MTTSKLTAEQAARVQTAALDGEGRLKLFVILSLVLVATDEERVTEICTKFQDAYDALFDALGGRPNGTGSRPDMIGLPQGNA